jgi:hypothetical protein
MRVAIASVLALALGIAGGFIAGRWTTPATPSNTIEQTGLFDGPMELGIIEVFYPQPFARPPELTITEEKQDPHSAWEWQVLEQRSDGFKLKFRGWGGTSRNKLRYRARSTVGGVSQQGNPAEAPAAAAWRGIKM